MTVQEEDFDPEVYYMVGAKEADSRNNKISNESPFGKALMGHKVGETVVAETPGGKTQIKDPENRVISRPYGSGFL